MLAVGGKEFEMYDMRGRLYGRTVAWLRLSCVEY